jgi:hypothetical protein
MLTICSTIFQSLNNIFGSVRFTNARVPIGLYQAYMSYSGCCIEHAQSAGGRSNVRPCRD